PHTRQAGHRYSGGPRASWQPSRTDSSSPSRRRHPQRRATASPRACRNGCRDAADARARPEEAAVFIRGTLTCGVGVGLVIMGTLATVNQISPPEHRGEVISSFFVTAYIGLSIPAIGVGIASEHEGFFR